MHYQTQLLITKSGHATLEQINELADMLGFKLEFRTNNPDLHQINSVGDTITIDTTRKLKIWNETRSYCGGNKMCVLHHCELLTAEAQNSLLKVLEEPSENTLILLVCSNINTLLETIISRVQIRNTVNYKDNIEIEEHILHSKKFLTSKLPVRLQMVDQILKKEIDRATLVKSLQGLLVELRNSPTNGLKENIDICLTAIRAITSNANIRLTLETLAISMKEETV